MSLRTALVLVLGLAACSRDAGLEAALEEGKAEGFAISGTVYGFTGTPDSQRVAIAGTSVTFIRTGDLPGPDTLSVPDTLPQCPIEMLCGRTTLHRGVFALDTVIPPPGRCSDGEPAATVTTDATGSYTAGDLPAGVYALTVTPAPGSDWKALEYCSFELRADWPIPFDVYLTADN
jgi:hypothetical protein